MSGAAAEEFLGGLFRGISGDAPRSSVGMTTPKTMNTVVDHLHRLAVLTGKVLSMLVGDSDEPLSHRDVDRIIDAQMVFAEGDGDIVQVRRLTAARDFYAAAAEAIRLSEDGVSAELDAAMAKAETSAAAIDGRHLALVEDP